MPTYQYACTECGHAFEQVQSFTEDSLTVCPVCSGRLRKVFNAVGVVFKGSGFYRNDSRGSSSSSETAAAKTETKSESKSDSGSGSKTESKPAAPAAAKPSSSSSSSSD
jgi:putative FmdB family regulatory protein